jgi:thioredoxin reductase (NADPH)
MYDVIILGGGPAGLTVGLYTGRAKLKTLLLEGSHIGGNAAWIDQLENYPGFPFGVSGMELMNDFQKQAERFGVEIRMEEVIKLESLPEGKKVTTYEGEYWARAVVIALGAKRRELEVPGEQEFKGSGVSYCATCDAAFFENYPVAVVGGGDSAVNEALFLSSIASKVYLIHRREGFRANQTSVDKMLENDKIELKTNKIVTRIEGEGLMQRVILQDVNTGEEEVLPVEGLFVSIGLVAAAEFLEGVVDTKEGYVITDAEGRTSVEGIFAAGDIRVKNTRQVATAVGDGSQVGMIVSAYLKE